MRERRNIDSKCGGSRSVVWWKKVFGPWSSCWRLGGGEFVGVGRGGGLVGWSLRAMDSRRGSGVRRGPVAVLLKDDGGDAADECTSTAARPTPSLFCRQRERQRQGDQLQRPAFHAALPVMSGSGSPGQGSRRSN